MSQKIKNIIIFSGIAIIFILIYIFFIKKGAPEANLSSDPNALAPEGFSATTEPPIAQDFLKLLLSVKTIKLDDSIFSEKSFTNLNDSSIQLIQDGNEGRPNPFAPIGSDNLEANTNLNSINLNITGLP